MCVIALVQTEDQRLTSDQIGRMWNNNSFGAGAAWFSTRKSKTSDEDQTILHWKKGLTEKEVEDLLPTLPLPYAVHFRNPSPNTSLNQMACHPFVVDASANCQLGGTLIAPDAAVIMHNGFWSQWREKLLDFGLMSRHKIPGGVWTDSRGIALAAHIMGPGVLDLINEKVLYFGNDIIQTYGNGWVTLQNGLLVSNTTWQHVTVHHGNHNSNAANTNRSHANAYSGSGYLAELDKKAALKEAEAERTGGAAPQSSFRTSEGEAGKEEGQGTATYPRLVANPGRTDAAVDGGSNQQEGLQQEGEAVSGRPTRRLRNQPQTSGATDCEDCGGRGWVQIGGVRRCWECWDKAQRAVTPSGTCETCSQVETTALRMDNGEWMCGDCWRQHGKPEIVRNQDLTKTQRAALQAKQMTGGTI